MSSPDLAARLIGRLTERGLTIAAAESLTGGELIAELTSVPGASAVVLGGAVVYATALKHSLLGVDEELLEREGPVHPDVARQLADGVRERLAVSGRPADIGLSTTGVAGPDPQGGRSVGTVFIGLSLESGTRVVELALDGDRAQIRRQVVDRVLAELAMELGIG
ncbi:CinA family protein [Leifsonia poae]|uniref:CinA family protein n=1 Tax=Leifsonia poae TaxID=110933 RepID=UPI001CC1A4E2|nr:CinA family protein [Leifsonia poae]